MSGALCNNAMHAGAAAVAAFLLVLSGCTIDAVGGYTWDKARHINEVRIVKHEVADAPQACRQFLPNEVVAACAVFRGNYCDIYVPPDSPALVAHESAHCFGYAHPGEGMAAKKP
jgi:hypothetical protein